MSSSINKNVNVERRTWDKETYEARAKSRSAAEAAAETAGGGSASTSSAPIAAVGGGDAAAAIKNEINPTEQKEEFLPAQQGREGPMGSQRAFLKSRSRKVDLEGKLGSTEIIDPAAASATKSNLLDDTIPADGAAPLTPSSGVSKCTDGVGWHCRVCDCFLKDSLTYLDHINGRKHQRFLGYSMRVEKSTTEEVSGVLKGLADKKREREGGSSGGILGTGAAAAVEVVDFEDVVRKKDEEALRRKAERARRREERKRKEKEEKNGAGQLNVVTENNDEEKQVTTNDSNPAEEDEEEEEGGVDPNLAAMMGFGGFGGSRK
ncbi:hypothetical protein ACHAXR_013376 [Thalassiosira sp. AJA248-18]